MNLDRLASIACFLISTFTIAAIVAAVPDGVEAPVSHPVLSQRG